MTVRENIVNALKDRVVGINGLKVGVWTLRKITEADCPYLDIRDIGCTYDTSQTNGLSFNQLDVKMVLYAVGVDVVNQLRNIVASIYEIIGSDDTLGGLADYIEIESDEFDIEQHERVVGAASIDLKVFYKTREYEM